MAPRTIYGSLGDGLQNLSLFDQSFADASNLGVTPCTAAGTNAIVLTPITSLFPPTITTPQTLQLFSFVATATSTNSVTVQVGTISARNLLRMDGATQAAANDIVSGVAYLIGWNGSVFQILAPVSNEINPVITGATISGSTITTSTYNGNTWTAGTGTLTLGAGKTLTANNSLTLAGVDGTTLTFQGTDTYVGRATTDTLTNKTLTSPTITGATITTSTFNGNAWTAGTGTLTVGAGKTLTANNTLTLAGTDGTTLTFQGTDTYVGRATTDTLTNKTLTSPVLSVTSPLTAATLGFQGAGGPPNYGDGSSNHILVSTDTAQTLINKTIDTAGPNTLKVGGVTLSAGQYPGETSTGSATAGNVGEFVSANVAQASAAALTSGSILNITSVALTAGEWDIYGVIGFIPGGTTTITRLGGSIETSNSIFSSIAPNSTLLYFPSFAPGANAILFNVGPLRVSLSGATTYYLNAVSTFATSTNAAFGYLRARRAR